MLFQRHGRLRGLFPGRFADRRRYRLRPKIQNLRVSVFGHENVRRFDVAMNDLRRVRRIQRIRNLPPPSFSTIRYAGWFGRSCSRNIYPLREGNLNLLGEFHLHFYGTSQTLLKRGIVSSIRALFWDVGGVLATNAWDRTERGKALEHFQLDPIEFHDRHEMLVSSFERGKITLDDYLDRTVFYRERPFTKGEFKAFMFAISQPFTDVLEFAQALADSGKCFMGTINNESRELNDYRIETFGMKKIFKVFASSCFVGFRKPEEDIYRLALEITQFPAEECCFIDDRPLNLDAAAKFGMRTIQMQSLAQLRADLEKLGVAAKSS